MTSRRNVINPESGIAGSIIQLDNLLLDDELLKYGSKIDGLIGNSASIIPVSPTTSIVSGLTGTSLLFVGTFLTLTDAYYASNNNTFQVISYKSDTSVEIYISSAPLPDPNNGNISWTVRRQYSIESDINYIRTDRRLIKGTTHWYDDLPTYNQPSATNIPIPTNLTNISGKTTDAISYNINKGLFGISVSFGQSNITINSSSIFKHSDIIDNTGVPCFDKDPFTGDFKSCYVYISDGYSDAYAGQELVVLNGFHAGEKIFALTYEGSSTSPNSIQIYFYSSPINLDYSLNAIPYIWENNQTNLINIMYSYNEKLDSLDINALRSIPAIGIFNGGGGSTSIINPISTNSKQIEIDFGNILTNYKTFSIIDSDVNINSKLFPSQAGNASSDRSSDENEMDPIIFSANPLSGKFTLIATSLNGPIVGKYKVNYNIG